jgi:hypothetical protein
VAYCSSGRLLGQDLGVGVDEWRHSAALPAGGGAGGELQRPRGGVGAQVPDDSLARSVLGPGGRTAAAAALLTGDERQRWIARTRSLGSGVEGAGRLRDKNGACRVVAVVGMGSRWRKKPGKWAQARRE